VAEQEATVQLIDEHAWERAEVVPIGEPLTVSEWLAKVDRLGMTLGVLPPHRIAGGAYDGGWVVSADNERGRLYFAVPAAAAPYLRDRVPAATLSAWR
jgi:hypothetical protein